jgi:very-short-patch-repair endonuclease
VATITGTKTAQKRASGNKHSFARTRLCNKTGRTAMTGIPPLATGRTCKAQPIKLPQALSVGEETFAFHMKARGLNPVREFQFHPERKFRFDFCFVEQKLAIEIDGGSKSYGRHNRSAGFSADCVKLNLAAQLGYRVLRYTTEMVTRGLADMQVAQILGVL